MLLLSFLTITTTTASSAAASGGHPSSPWRYDVFLSFRGADVRHSFTAHLYDALVRKGIRAFIDDIDLPRGQNIAEAIPRAIEESRFSVVVLSKGYASSQWCLDELVKIVHECSKESDDKGGGHHGHQSFPVFYHVDPSDVSDVSSGCYKRDFNSHKRRFTYHRVNRWRRALNSIAGIAGWVLPKHGSEAQLVEDIATYMLWKIQELGGRDGDHDNIERDFGTERVPFDSVKYF